MKVAQSRRDVAASMTASGTALRSRARFDNKGLMFSCCFIFHDGRVSTVVQMASPVRWENILVIDEEVRLTLCERCGKEQASLAC